MLDILLIQPPVRDFYITAKRTIPYGLTCIASALIREGFTVEILDLLAVSRSRVIDLPKELKYLRKYYHQPDSSPFSLFYDYKHFGYSYEYLAKQVREIKPFLIGISSLFTSYQYEVLETAKTVKVNYPEGKIVLGGHHATVLPEELMKSTSVDYVLRGEGEVSMPRLAKALKENSGISQIPGIVYRDLKGKLRVKKPVYMKNIDKYPLPAINLLKNKYYRRGKKGSVVIVATRGCPMNCSYCSMGKNSGIVYRKRKIDSVINEIRTAIQKYHVGFIDFEDENISLDRNWFLELLHEIQLNFKGLQVELRAMNGIYPPSLDEEVIQNMKKAGFKNLNLSLGTISKKQLNQFNREDVSVHFERALYWAEKYGMEAVGYVIVGAPNQDPKDSIRDLLYLAERRVLAGVSVFYPAPESKDYKVCLDMGILPDHFFLMRSTSLPISHLTTRKDTVTLMRLGRILNFAKSLVDLENEIPEPAPLPRIFYPDSSERLKIGKILLKGFLNDGKIRGINSQGGIFVHNISTNLTELFIKGIMQRRIRGYREAVNSH